MTNEEKNSLTRVIIENSKRINKLKKCLLNLTETYNKATLLLSNEIDVPSMLIVEADLRHQIKVLKRECTENFKILLKENKIKAEVSEQDLGHFSTKDLIKGYMLIKEKSIAEDETELGNNVYYFPVTNEIITETERTTKDINALISLSYSL